MAKNNNELFNDYLDGIISTAAALREKVNGTEFGKSIEITSSWLGDIKSIDDRIDDLSSEVCGE